MARIEGIITVTRGGILYKDIAEIVRWLDFALCYEQYTLHFNGTELSIERFCVGRSSFHLAPLPYVEFFTDPITRLEFDKPEDLSDLLNQIHAYGFWYTQDLDEPNLK
jgi:hypothetical protein